MKKNLFKIEILPFLGEHADLDIRTKSSYHVLLNNHTFMFVADSNNLDSKIYEHIASYIGPVNKLFVGMECKGAPLSWLYGPLYPSRIPAKINQSRRLSGSNSQKVMDMIKKLKCESVYIYAMGLEPWLNYIMAVDYFFSSDKLFQIKKRHKLNPSFLKSL